MLAKCAAENSSKYPQNDEDEYSVEISSCRSGNIPKLSQNHPKDIPKMLKEISQK